MHKHKLNWQKQSPQTAACYQNPTLGTLQEEYCTTSK